MRKILTAVCVGTLTGVAMLAAAAGPADNRTETRAYFNLGFGGTHDLPSNFHYGLRLDQNRRYAPAGAPAAMQLDMTGSGTMNARLNGVDLLRRNLSANDDEGGTAGATTTTWSAADWGLIVLGVAGVGYAGYEVSKSHQNEGSSSSGGSTTPAPTGGVTGTGLLGGTTPTGGTPPLCAPGTVPAPIGGQCLPVPFAARNGLIVETRDVEYQEWLDGGTGHMGDLAPAK